MCNLVPNSFIFADNKVVGLYVSKIGAPLCFQANVIIGYKKLTQKQNKLMSSKRCISCLGQMLLNIDFKFQAKIVVMVISIFWVFAVSSRLLLNERDCAVKFSAPLDLLWFFSLKFKISFRLFPSRA